jgi:hypothetical protein
VPWALIAVMISPIWSMSTAIGFYLALLSLVGLVCIALTRDTPTDPLSPGNRRATRGRSAGLTGTN